MSDPIWHPWTKWECYKAGMFDGKTDLSPDECKREYAKFLSDIPRFEAALNRVLDEWPISCEHFLSNRNFNRIAWLGQASMCIDTGIPCIYRAGFTLLTTNQQIAANKKAKQYLDLWRRRHAEQDFRVRPEMEAAWLF